MTRITKLLSVLAFGLLLVGLATAQTATTTTTTTDQTTAAPPAPNNGVNNGSNNGGTNNNGNNGTNNNGPNTGHPLNVGPGSHEQGHGWENHVNNREEHQQDRIANGIKDGQLSAAQASQLEKSQAKIQQQEAQDEAAHNGHLTPKEKAQFQKEQNAQSRKIHNERHPKK